MNKEALEKRKQGLLLTKRDLEDQVSAYAGAIAECDYWLSVIDGEAEE